MKNYKTAKKQESMTHTLQEKHTTESAYRGARYHI